MKIRDLRGKWNAGTSKIRRQNRAMRHEQRRVLRKFGLVDRAESQFARMLGGAGLFALGAAAGGVLGILLAPERGKKLRSRAGKKVRKVLPAWKRGTLPGQEQIYERTR